MAHSGNRHDRLPEPTATLDVMAERASQIELAEIGVHTRSCPDCRDLLAELAKVGAIIAADSSAEHGETVRLLKRRPLHRQSGRFRADG